MSASWTAPCSMRGDAPKVSSSAQAELVRSVPASQDGRRSGRSGELKIASRIMAVLKECGKLRDLELGKKLHRGVIAARLDTDRYIAATLIEMYSKCGSLQLARQVFDKMPDRDVATWNALISSYAHNGASMVAINLFSSMDCEPDAVTYAAVLNACGRLASEIESERLFCLHKGVEIHRQVKDHGFESDNIVANTLVDMYSKCGRVDCAREVFDRMSSKTVVSWTSLIMGYVQNGESLVAMDLFTAMDCEPSSFTYVAALKACGSLASEQGTEKRLCLHKGTSIHKRLKKQRFHTQMFVSNALIDMYSKCGSMASAREVFDDMSSKDKTVVTWTSLILGYVQNGESLVAMDLFAAMDCKPNSFTYVVALKACENLGALAAGQQIHASVLRLGIEEEIVTNTLMDFFGKCGCMSRAEEIFNNMQVPNVVSWTTLITGYSCFGDSCKVFGLVKKMQEAGLQMNSITFVCVLMACSHAGLLEQGKLYFDSMPGYGIRWTLDHYNCMIDMLGRANRLQEALTLVNNMAMRADTVTWTILLGACRKWKNLEVGRIAFDALLASDPTGDGNAAYVLMSDIYKSLSMSEDLEQMEAERKAAQSRSKQKQRAGGATAKQGYLNS